MNAPAKPIVGHTPGPWAPEELHWRNHFGVPKTSFSVRSGVGVPIAELCGQATDVLLSLRSEYCALACILFTRANGVRIALFEDRQPSHTQVLAAIDKAILLAEREAVA